MNIANAAAGIGPGPWIPGSGRAVTLLLACHIVTRRCNIVTTDNAGGQRGHNAGHTHTTVLYCQIILACLWHTNCVW
jgi:hypothetical protein